MRVFVDLDDVCQNFTFDSLEMLGALPGFTYPDVKSYQLAAEALGICTPDINVWDNFPMEMWQTLKPSPLYYPLMGLLSYAKNRGIIEGFQILSSNKPTGCVAHKLIWIKRHGVIGMDATIFDDYKKPYCICSNDLLIDDMDHNINGWKGASILVPKPWNRMRHMYVDQQKNACDVLFWLCNIYLNIPISQVFSIKPQHTIQCM